MWGMRGAGKPGHRWNCLHREELPRNHVHTPPDRVPGGSGKNGKKALHQPPGCPNRRF